MSKDTKNRLTQKIVGNGNIQVAGDTMVKLRRDGKERVINTHARRRAAANEARRLRLIEEEEREQAAIKLEGDKRRSKRGAGGRNRLRGL